ncbi:hypothetical protein ACP70R_010898 [Stipagrostis hirtigluma subsp. patula]
MLLSPEPPETTTPSPELASRKRDGCRLPVRPSRRLAPARPLLRAGQGGRGHRRALAAVALAVAHVGAVNLDSRSYGRRLSVAMREGFFHGAEAALAAARIPLRRLTFHVELEAVAHQEVATFLSRREDGSEHDMVGAVLSNPAARRVEELHVAALRSGCVAGYTGGFYKLSYCALRSEALRVLHITNCSDLAPAPPAAAAAAFPRLAELRLQGCEVSPVGLQGMINAAPQLATLHLECIYLSDDDDGEEEPQASGSPARRAPSYRLRCAAVTALVLANCRCPCWVHGGVELDVPRLRYLSFKGFVCDERLSLISRASELGRVDLHFVDHVSRGDDRVRVPFWRFLRESNFNNTKVLKLKLDYPIDHIAVAEKEGDWDELLGSKLFHDLQHLELEVTYCPSSNTPALAMANLLYCCPVVCDLRLKLSKVSNGSRPRLSPSDLRCFAETKSQLNFKESVDRFKHRRILSAADEDENYDEVSNIPGLSERSFNCLEKYLRRVSLQFRMGTTVNCFGAQLAKFFTENAVALEEMYIDDGNHRICGHLSRKVGRWTANLSKRRNLTNAKGFIVLPHET